MNEFKIFSEALGLKALWSIKDIKFIGVHPSEKVLHIDLEYVSQEGYHHQDGSEYPITDYLEITHRYYHFLNCTCYLHINLPCFLNSLHKKEQALLPVNKKTLLS
jgi:hypothetical protein